MKFAGGTDDQFALKDRYDQVFTGVLEGLGPADRDRLTFGLLMAFSNKRARS